MDLVKRLAGEIIIGMVCLLVWIPALALEVDEDGQFASLDESLVYFEDRSGTLQLDQVRASNINGRFTAVEGVGVPNFGYTASTVWLRAELKNRSGEREWLLELPFATLDEVELFLIDPTTGETLEHYLTGDRSPFSQRPLPHRHFLFPLNLEREKTHTLYLRVRTQGSMTVPLRLWQREAFALESRNGYMAMTLYFGMLTALFAYNLLLFFSLRDRTYFYYVAFVASMALGMGAWSGLFFEYLWPDEPGWGNLAAMTGFNLTGMFGAIFSRTFLNSREHVPVLDRAMKYCAIAFGMLVVAAPLVSYQLVAMSTSLIGSVFSLLAVISGVRCLRDGQLSARYFLIAWGILLVGTAALGARNLDLLPTNFFTLHAMQLGSALEMLLLSFALAERITELRIRKEVAEGRALEAHRQMVETLQRTENELEKRVSERTFELTKLNERLKKQESQLKGMALQDPLTGLANRILLGQRIEEAFEKAEQDNERLALLMIDMDHFKPINDRFGHEVGDRLLRTVAGRLQKLVRKSDTVARLGGDEFVILLNSLDNDDTILRIGEAVVREVSQPIWIDDIPLEVSVSVGVANYPENGVDAASLLRYADKAMYDAKRQGRNRLYYPYAGEDAEMA